MFHKALEVTFLTGTALDVLFQDGNVKRYDISVLFEKYPPLEALRDRTLFLSGKLEGGYGIVWNDDLDLEAETIYQEGLTVRMQKPAAFTLLGDKLLEARARKGYTQKELADITGIDQSDISKIERGIANPSLNTLCRLADALDARLTLSIA